MVDISTLGEKLNALTGLDFELAETQERAAGNIAFDMTFSKSFQARLAAAALGVPAADIKELPIQKYRLVCTTVQNFLYSSSDDETPSTKSEKSPSN